MEVADSLKCRTCQLSPNVAFPRVGGDQKKTVRHSCAGTEGQVEQSDDAAVYRCGVLNLECGDGSVTLIEPQHVDEMNGVGTWAVAIRRGELREASVSEPAAFVGATAIIARDPDGKSERATEIAKPALNPRVR